MEAAKACVLVVDDDPHMLRMMARVLGLEGYQVLTASDSEIGLDVFCQESPDLVLLDIMLPGMDGYAMCRRIREFSQVPIIMVTAKGRDEERVEGLDTGADDYITKPFSSMELVARARAVLRRTTLWDEHPEPPFHLGDLMVDFASHRAVLAEKEVNLTAMEYRLLSYMARNVGRVLTPDQILENVWGGQYLGADHLLQVTISRLRQKLGDSRRAPRYIVTKPGIGYTIARER